LEEIGIEAPNTCMLGVFAAVTRLINLDAIASGLEDYFADKKLEKNIRCAERGFQESKIIQF
jgi:Pyruvate/2-oxoacid:ferredoxin oxidoreductase gamma subunit